MTLAEYVARCREEDAKALAAFERDMAKQIELGEVKPDQEAIGWDWTRAAYRYGAPPVS
jgi:hypothetical protein